MKGLATVFACDGRFEEAVALHRDAFEIRVRTLGEDHPDTVGSMNDLVIAYCGQGRLDDAAPLVVKSIEIKRLTPDADRSRMLASLESLTDVFVIDARRGEAIALYERAITIAREALGDEHPTTIRMIDEYNRMTLAPAAPNALPEE